MKKVGELITKEAHFVIYYNEETKYNPYKIYNKWFRNGWHKTKLNEYTDLASCVHYIYDYMESKGGQI